MGSTEASTFYDQHPFDWVPADAAGPVRAVVSPPFTDWIENLDANSLVLDMSCGQGNALSSLARRGIRCMGLDRGRVSVGLAAERYRRCGVVEEWCAAAGARVALYDENRGANVHSLCLVKELNQQIAHDSRSPSAAEVLLAEKRGVA